MNLDLMRLPTKAIAITALALSFASVPAAAEDPDASRPPTTSGPILGVAFPCEDNGRASRNEVKGQSCSWTYHLVPADTDAQDDFGAYWFQMELDPGKGMCAKQLRFELDAPSNGRIVSAVPADSGRIRSRSIATTELVVDGGGTAVAPGTISQEVAQAPGRVRVSLDGNHYSYEWTGNSRDKVMVAIGIQLSSRRLPPEFFASWSEGEGAGMGSCRVTPTMIRAR